MTTQTKPSKFASTVGGSWVACASLILGKNAALSRRLTARIDSWTEESSRVYILVLSLFCASKAEKMSDRNVRIGIG